ncbi:hypothetical protein SeMB42_g01414 [Synchytrium endobioticum]|uniref:Cullin family profile domain-containing protein n=1 Tax=Synchytrium endobioticum TaxID=286115 RepID=A0A507DNI7_9FUNG|nr:hypothetical protein SeMB42_g01414 [Synchytrium endobioticum]
MSCYVMQSLVLGPCCIHRTYLSPSSHSIKRPLVMSSANRRPKTGAKIKPVRKGDSQFDETWAKLSTAIREIYRKNASALSFEELYRNAYNMVLNKHGDKLYNGVKDVIGEHLDNVVGNNIAPLFPQTVNNSTTGSDILTGGLAFLRQIKDVWEDHTTCMLMIRDILMYMDRVYVKTAGLPIVYEMGLELFRDRVVRSDTHPILSHHLNDTLLYEIRRERSGESIERQVVKSIIEMMLILPSALERVPANNKLVTTGGSTVYEADFEPAFLHSSTSFYVTESTQYLREPNATEYLKQVERRLMEEEERTKHYLSSATEPKIRTIVEQETIYNHVKTIIDMEGSGLIPMIEFDKYDDLSRMYKLFGRVSNGHTLMKKGVAEHLQHLGKCLNETLGGLPPTTDMSEANGTSNSFRTGVANTTSTTEIAKGTSTLTMDAEDDATGAQGDTANSSSAAGGGPSPLKWVEAILQLKDKFDAILDRSVGKDKSFQTDMNSALEAVINKNTRSPEFVSLFIDENLRKGLKGKSEEEAEIILDKTITIFRFIHEKDVFERYYKQHLAKRLLFGRSISDDVEKSMIAKLKVECGYQFTTKLEGMFQDMRMSTDTQADFRTYTNNIANAPATNVDLSVSVLTSTFWPISNTSSTCIYPQEISIIMEHFQKFYLGRHSGRRLTWLPNMGTADLRAQFSKAKKELNLSTHGMLVLVGVFNRVADGEWVSYQRIQDETQIPESDLRRCLQSLAVAKFKILLKKAKGREVGRGDEFQVNANFTHQLQKIKILTIASASSGTTGSTNNQMENETERGETTAKIEEQRKHVVEAAIVRVMKARQRMMHNDLVIEVTKQLSGRFAPEPAAVKKRIEGLIEREYLERDKADRKLQQARPSRGKTSIGSEEERLHPPAEVADGRKPEATATGQGSRTRDGSQCDAALHISVAQHHHVGCITPSDPPLQPLGPAAILHMRRIGLD